MNNKILALLVSAVMVMVAWVAAISVPGAEGEGDGKDPTSPYMLMGTENAPFWLAEGQEFPGENNFYDPFGDPLQIDINRIAFNYINKQSGPFYPDVSFQIIPSNDAFSEAYGNGVPSDAPAITGTVGVTAAVQDAYNGTSGATGVTADPFVYKNGSDSLIEFTINDVGEGVYEMTINPVAEMDPTYFLIKVTVNADYREFGEYAAYFYYGVYVKVVSEEAYLANDYAAVVLSTEDISGTAKSVENKLTPNDEAIEITQDEEMASQFAFVQFNKDGDGTSAVYDYDNSVYDFYAYGLPEGIAMKLDGEITGKVASTVSANVETPFKVFAVNKENPRDILCAEYIWKVVGGEDTFEVTIDDGTSKPSSEDQYIVMNNYGETKDISWGAEGDDAGLYKVVLTYAVETEEGSGDYKKDITPEGAKTVTIGGDDVSLDGITGIVQVQITKFVNAEQAEPVDTAIIHILVVGPVVHSGLAPVVTAI